VLPGLREEAKKKRKEEEKKEEEKEVGSRFKKKCMHCIVNVPIFW
jgi:hypothetical protein